MIIKSLITGLVGVLVLSLLVIAQQMPTGATLRGRFVYEDTGLPLRRAWVGLKMIRGLPASAPDANMVSNIAVDTLSSNGNSIGEEGALVLTGDNGEYVLKDIAPGIYFPYVKQAGIFNPESEQAEDPNFRSITVIGNDEIELDFAVKRGGSIEGRVTYSDGSPAPGVRVARVRSDADEADEDEKFAVNTDDRGVYRFAGLNRGDYFVFVSEPVVHTNRSVVSHDYQLENYARSSMLKVFYPGNYSIREARPIAVQLGQEQLNVDIVVPNHTLTDLTGMVVSARDKSPIADLSVSFRMKDDEFQFELYGQKMAVTDENGLWAFNELLPGKYVVTAGQKGPYSGASPTTDNENKTTRYAPLSKVIEIVEGVNESVVFELETAASLSGTIEYDGEIEEEEGKYPYIFVSAFDETQDLFSSAFAIKKENGGLDFELSDLSAGRFGIRLTASNGAYVKSVLLNGNDITESRIEVASGESIKGIRIILGTDLGTLEGRVTNAFIKPGRWVYLTSVDYSEREGTSSFDTITSDGKFKLRAKPGRYYLVTKDFEGNSTDNSEERRSAWDEWVKGAEIVELKAGETIKKTITVDR